MGAKKFFKCTVCNDLHFGENGPQICPTCLQENKYIEINNEEAKKEMGLE